MPSVRTGPGDREAEPGPSDRARRAELRARLAAERAELLCAFLGIEIALLEDAAILNGRSASDLLSAVAIQEESFARSLEGEEAGDRALAVSHGHVSGHNTFARSLEHCIAARTRFLDVLARVPDDRIFDTDGEAHSTSALSLATRCFWNDASLSVRAASWSRGERLGESVGPSSLLQAAARAARKELLTTVSLVPRAARDVPAFEGGRTLPHVFRMVTGLQRMFLDALVQAGYGHPSVMTPRPSYDADAWKSSWDELHQTHVAVLDFLKRLDDRTLALKIADGEGTLETIYTWARGCLLHDRLHAAHIRADLNLDWPERLLR